MKDESHLPFEEQSLVYRLRKRAEIRSQIKDRKSVQEGRPDRIALLLTEAATVLEQQQNPTDRFDDWYNELESFSFRSERLMADLESMIKSGQLNHELINKWLHAAYLQGQSDVTRIGTKSV